jgi:hypothetical protein
MSLNPADIRRIKDAYNEAAKNYPHPDRPLMSMGSKVLSMTELASEVENETPIGKRLIKVIDEIVSSGETTVNDVVRSLTRKPAQPW